MCSKNWTPFCKHLTLVKLKLHMIKSIILHKVSWINILRYHLNCEEISSLYFKIKLRKHWLNFMSSIIAGPLSKWISSPHCRLFRDNKCNRIQYHCPYELCYFLDKYGLLSIRTRLELPWSSSLLMDII